MSSHIDSYFGIAGVSGMKNDFMTTVSIDFIANKYICEEYLIHAMSEMVQLHLWLQLVEMVGKGRNKNII